MQRHSLSDHYPIYVILECPEFLNAKATAKRQQSIKTNTKSNSNTNNNNRDRSVQSKSKKRQGGEVFSGYDEQHWKKRKLNTGYSQPRYPVNRKISSIPAFVNRTPTGNRMSQTGGSDTDADFENNSGTLGTRRSKKYNRRVIYSDTESDDDDIDMPPKKAEVSLQSPRMNRKQISSV